MVHLEALDLLSKECESKVSTKQLQVSGRGGGGVVQVIVVVVWILWPTQREWQPDSMVMTSA